MIKNERQYRMTRSRVDEVKNSIAELAQADLPPGLDPGMRDLQLEALRSVLDDLEAELADYDALHTPPRPADQSTHALWPKGESSR